MSDRAVTTVAIAVVVSLASGLFASDPQVGFPLLWHASPGKICLRDVTGDGIPEIVTSRGLDVVVIGGDGSLLPGWPYNIPSALTGYRLPPLVGDIDGDGQLEIVVETSTDKRITALTLDGQLKPGWPIEVDSHGSSIKHMCLGDVDNDGDMEILVGDGSQLHGILFVYDGVGQYHPGFPKVFEELSSSFAIAGVAVGDLEFDGINEIVVSFSGYQGGWLPSPVFLLHGDGTTKPGWPRYPPGTGGALIAANPAIADLDGDLTCEIVASFGEVFIMNHDGTPFAAAYPALGSVNTPVAVGDVDSDGVLEVVSGGQELKVWRPFSVLAETSTTDAYQYYAALAIADFTGDGLAEIAAWSIGTMPGSGPHMEYVHLLDLNMNNLPGWPKAFSPWSRTPPRSIAIADLDGDNDLEVIFPNEVCLHVWDVENPGPGTPRVEWSMLGHDSHKAGFYHTGNIPRRHYLRGDANRSGVVDMADAMAILEYMFFDETTPCAAQQDFDVDGQISMMDAVCILQYLFFMGSPPSQPPFPDCAAAPLGETLPCTIGSCP